MRLLGAVGASCPLLVIPALEQAVFDHTDEPHLEAYKMATATLRSVLNAQSATGASGGADPGPPSW
jgi:hypothetical protein